MRTTAAIVLGLLLTTAARGAESAPSPEALAQMGLGGLEIMSDEEAANVRGMGFIGFDGAHLFKNSLRVYQKQVKQFEKQVWKFQRAVDKHLRHFPGSGKHAKHGGKFPKNNNMKPPKMPNGGKPS